MNTQTQPGIVVTCVEKLGRRHRQHHAHHCQPSSTIITTIVTTRTAMTTITITMKIITITKTQDLNTLMPILKERHQGKNQLHVLQKSLGNTINRDSQHADTEKHNDVTPNHEKQWVSTDWTHPTLRNQPSNGKQCENQPLHRKTMSFSGMNAPFNLKPK